MPVSPWKLSLPPDLEATRLSDKGEEGSGLSQTSLAKAYSSP